MTTTTIRLEDALKDRVAQAARRAGKSSHAFILEAIEKIVAEDEFDADLAKVAGKRWDALVATGESVAWSDARRHLEARVKGKEPGRPVARKLAR